MRYQLNFPVFAGAAAGLISGCAGNTPITESGETAANYVLATELITRDGREGLRFTNDYEHCIAVAFAYAGAAPDKGGKTACYVPAETRVVYWQAKHYRILGEKSCARARREGFAGIATAQRLQTNYLSGQCEILGTFAD